MAEMILQTIGRPGKIRIEKQNQLQGITLGQVFTTLVEVEVIANTCLLSYVHGDFPSGFALTLLAQFFFQGTWRN